MFVSASQCILPVFVIVSGVEAIKLWSAPAALPTSIPASCRASLSTDIVCGPRLLRTYEVTDKLGLPKDLLTEYCNSTCTASLATWTTNVNTRCGNTKYDFGNNITQSGNDIAIPLKWTQDIACLTDKTTKEFCIPGIANKTVTACSDCVLKYFSGLLGSQWGLGKISEVGFTSLLSSCTAAATAYPHSTQTAPAAPIVTANNTIACTGANYTVKTGDSCQSIADANKVATDRLTYVNGLDFGCTSLTVEGSLCMPDTCLLYKVQANQTCKEVLNGKNFKITELTSWNPIIHTNCDNMDTLAGRTICISPPGTNSYDVNVTVSFNNTWTNPPSSWKAGPTIGTPTGNITTDWIPVVPTVTSAINATAASIYQPYITHCPVTDDDIDRGFEWQVLEPSCSSLLSSYCDPVATGTPLPATVFPTTCLPSYAMGW